METSEIIINTLTEITGVKGIKLDVPENTDFGDYSSNFALSGSKMLEAGSKFKNPKDLAQNIVEKLKDNKDLLEVVERIEIAGAGFINFYLKKAVLMDNLKRIGTEPEKYGSTDSLKGKKLMVEFAHPNTHKELHVGHMRTLTLGESLARIFEANGAQVFRANYQGDVGPHVAKAIWGVKKILSERNQGWGDVENLSLVEKARLLGEGYTRGSTDYEGYKDEIDSLNNKIYLRDPEVLSEYERTRNWSLEYYDSFYKRFGTKFDKLYFESQVYESGKQLVLDNTPKVFKESEGAIVLEGEEYGLHTRVFITKDGNPTYEGKEMALAYLQTSDFDFDKNIHVVANEQSGYFQVVIKALELIDPKFKDKQFHLPMGMVQLVGKKISSRTGDIVRVDEIIETVKKLILPLIDKQIPEAEKDNLAEIVALGAIKIAVLKVNPKADVAFDMENTVSLEGFSGPYLQYTYARTQSVIVKANNTNQNAGVDNLEKINNDELAVLRHLIHFPEIVAEAGEKYAPNLICSYLYELAKRYNTLYNSTKIIGSELEDFRLSLTTETGTVLKNGLNLLGIQTPERM